MCSVVVSCVVVWCFCGGVVFLWWCSCVFVVVFCVVWCFCGGVCVFVYFGWCSIVFGYIIEKL